MPGAEPLIVRIGGGLGNQVFMYAAGYALAKRHGRPLLIDTSWYLKTKFRSLELPQLTGPLPVAFEGDIRRYALLPIDSTKAGLAPVVRCLGAVAGCLLGVKIMREQENLDLRLQQVATTRGIYLLGYFQDYHFFDDSAAELRALLHLRQTPSEESAALLAEVGDGARWSSVHVRRGDYVAMSDQNALSGDYYRHAVDRIQEHAGEVKWLVFSDDPAWAREHLTLPGPKRVVDHNRNRPWEDLALMAACKNHIIANSTFSWWGAWLGQQPGGLTVAPATWFPGKPTASGLLPPGWLTI